MEEGGIHTLPLKQHTVALLAPSQPQMSTSSGSSQQFPSTDDFNGLPSSDSSPPRSIDQPPEHTTLFSHKVPTSTSALASQGLCDTESFNGVTQSAHAVQDNYSLSLDFAPNLNPIIAQFGQPVTFWNGWTITLNHDYTVSNSYDPTHDLR
ncbi:hypothetical protein IQ07DRAFT_592516 [Pyrenochaeta sp. DS3sAY3a]|nr:hypothetical protein IQ07DRAFT_592516 [Pyrenochaeta sp. DS3sAY3a]